MTYTYDTRAVSKYALKLVEHACHKDPNRTRLVGVMCKSCPFYEGMASKFIDSHIDRNYDSYAATRYVVCNGYEKDDEGPDVGRIRSAIYSTLEDRALKALCY